MREEADKGIRVGNKRGRNIKRGRGGKGDGRKVV